LAGRLPTEAEWELVARFNPESTEAPFTFPWGRTTPDGSIHANFADSGIGDPIAVGQRPAGASAFGVQDLSGNVAEWVLDWYREGYNPTDILNPTGPATQVDGQGRVVRGGSYNDSAEEIRGGYRTHSSVPQSTIGFRCIVQPTN
jgi:formylglycine-generating enzyme